MALQLSRPLYPTGRGQCQTQRIAEAPSPGLQPLSPIREAREAHPAQGRVRRARRINLFREGLDLPEVSLVAILDADKEGYLRSATSLIQTAGRAARHLNGEVILYADVKTQSIQKFLAVSEYRRQRQVAYNQEHDITPRSVVRAIEQSLSTDASYKQQAAAVLNEAAANFDVSETIRELEEEMLTAANNLEFEKAALLRDQIRELKRQFGQTTGPAKALATQATTAVSYRKGKKRR